MSHFFLNARLWAPPLPSIKTVICLCSEIIHRASTITRCWQTEEETQQKTQSFSAFTKSLLSLTPPYAASSKPVQVAISAQSCPSKKKQKKNTVLKDCIFPSHILMKYFCKYRWWIHDEKWGVCAAIPCSVILPPPHHIFKDISHDTATLHQPHRQHRSSEHSSMCTLPHSSYCILTLYYTAQGQAHVTGKRLDTFVINTQWR